MAERKLIVLALHAVFLGSDDIEKGFADPQQRLQLPHLEEALDRLQQLGYHFISPAEVENDTWSGLSCLLTFDDGYYNNVYAFALLKRYKIPAVMFIVPENIESRTSFWWDAVYRKGKKVGKSDAEIARLCRDVKRLCAIDRQKALQRVGLCKKDFMPVSDIDRPLTRSELIGSIAEFDIYIGNHTWDHDILTTCDRSHGIKSIADAQRYIDTYLPVGRRMLWLAFPNGNATVETFDWAASLGIHAGLTLVDRPLATTAPGDRGILSIGRFLLWGAVDMRRECTRIATPDLRDKCTRGARLLRKSARVGLTMIGGQHAIAPTSLLLKRPIYYIYADGALHSGQRRATELMIELLPASEYDAVRIGTPVFHRGRRDQLELFRFSVSILLTWLRGLVLIGAAPGVVHINLGQSMAAFVRDGFFAFAFGWRRGWRVIVSLHGAWFMSWDVKSWKVGALKRICEKAVCVTVLGEGQKQRLVEFGLEEGRIAIVDNTCHLSPTTPDEVRAKQRLSPVVHVLYLGLLVDTKGYPEFLEGVLEYARRHAATPLKVTFCGEPIAVAHAERFRNVRSATEYISNMINNIRATGSVDIEWVRGADGAEKDLLFRSASIFVLPTKLDAQPIVLLEAMASGCAIITSTVGEIRQTVGDEGAVFLREVSSLAVAEALKYLVEDPTARETAALMALSRFVTRFNREVYRSKWESIFGCAVVQGRG